MHDVIDEIASKALALIKDKTYAEAELLLQHALTASPYHHQVNYLLGVLYLEKGEPLKAEEYFRYVIRVRPHLEKPVYALSLVCERTGRPAMAEALMRRFMEIRQAAPDKPVLVLGDSHSEDCFSGITWCDARIVGFYTMHRVGRDGLDALDAAQHGATPGKTVVFIFGEIDVRLHIGRQRDRFGRDPGEIVTDLVTRYFATLRANAERCPGIRIVVSSIVPPSDRHPDDVFPKYGELDERIAFARRLNEELKRLSALHGYAFLDLYTLFAREDGAMDPAFTTDHVHVRRGMFRIVEHALATLLERMGR